MIYRPAVPADFEPLARLRWDFRTESRAVTPAIGWEEFREIMLQFLRESFSSGDWTVWVAEYEGKVIAQMYIFSIHKVPHPGKVIHRTFGYVTNVYTCPEFRNQGVGAELMRRVQAWAKEQKMEMLLLWPSEKAVPFYLRAGFQHPTEAMEFPIE